MCFKTTCEKCEKPTWKGCGKHIEEALKDVPEDERCKCPRDTPSTTTTATVEKKAEETTTVGEETKTANTEETKTAETKTAETKTKTD